jgi:peroxiredoxin
VLVRADGAIGSRPAVGADEIRALVAQSLGAPVPVPAAALAGAGGNGAVTGPDRPAPRIGDPAPALKLPDLAGKPVDLADFRGSQTLVLFWNPGCSFCQQMLDDLKAWERNLPDEAPRLLVVSSGSVEANKAMGLRSPVVLDQDFSVAGAFGATGTPNAVLVDVHGKIGSHMAVGAAEVLELAGTATARQARGRPAVV